VSTLRMTTAGESHGPGEVCVIEGIPSGLALTTAQIDRELKRRQEGYGRGGRMSIEADRARFMAGVRLGMTLGSPICILVENQDFVSWTEIMSPEAPEGPAGAGRGPGAGGALGCDKVPRPGHADLAGLAKHGFEDIRNVLERASARETVGRVAGGAVCKRFLEELGVTVRGRVTSIGAVKGALAADASRPETVEWETVEASAVACDDPVASAAMCEAIDGARAAGESLGGVFEVWCWGLCPGLGGYATMGDRLDGRLLGALGSIPAIKGVEVGEAFTLAEQPGSKVHDPVLVADEGGRRWVTRRSNRAGGLEGGMTNGMPLILRAAMKPIPTLTTPLPSVDVTTLEASPAHVERSDITAVPAARVVAEAMVAYVVAGAYLEKFGGDSMSEVLQSFSAYRAKLEDRGLWRRS
jgi:chorismate synthase